MANKYSFYNANVKVNSTTDDKLSAIKRWMDLGVKREYIIFLDTVTGNLYRANDMKMEEIIKQCYCQGLQAIEVIANEEGE